MLDRSSMTRARLFTLLALTLGGCLDSAGGASSDAASLDAGASDVGGAGDGTSPSSDAGPLLDVNEVSDGAVEADCITTSILYEDGSFFVGSQLNLQGAASPDDPGLLSWDWTVEPPEGSSTTLLPNSSIKTPYADFDAPGLYTFTLTVWHADGRTSCEPAVVEILVEGAPDTSLEIEIQWFAPGDPDPNDQGPGAGPDVDLHLLHPWADSWFEDPFDCFWFNPNPNWGSLDPSEDDDPELTQDSTDGSGPEQLLFPQPDPSSIYAIAVHVWADQGLGPTEVDLKIKVGGGLVYEETLTLAHHDLWEVALFDGGSGQLTVLEADGGGPLVTSDYENPLFVP